MAPARDAFFSSAQPGWLEVLSQEIDVDDLEGYYRLKIGDDAVRYLIVHPGVFREPETMYMPRLFLSALPPLPPPDTWTTMEMRRREDGEIDMETSYSPLPCAGPAWHENLVDVLSLQHIATYGPRVQEVQYQGCPAIAKIARFSFEVRYVRNETLRYRQIHDADQTGVGGSRQENGPEPGLRTPPFLGHLTENGRIIGLLLGKVEGDFARIDDLAICTTAIQQLHAVGLVHGDVNRHNFLIDRGQTAGQKPATNLLDFEHAEPWSAELAELEIKALEVALRDESRRGLQERA
ncbi:MAG: hypothetical protein M1832_002880 [Thelocarpon impressellum]|nr:MAG: hypothetical protein M1832_002880 [Thelocarpon impressellum]